MFSSLGTTCLTNAITTNHFRCLKGDILTTNQKVANISFQNVLKQDSEKSGKKSEFAETE
jgi:hypothetical protein